MARKNGILILLLIVIVIVTPLIIYFLSRGSATPQLLLGKAVRREIRVTVSTNGIIEPVNYSDVYAPIDAFVAEIFQQEGSEIVQGRPLMQLKSDQLRTALAEAKAALLQEKRQARVVFSGPTKEEVDVLDASIAEAEMQLDQQSKELRTEEALLAKGATPRITVDNLRKQRDLLQLRLDGLKRQKQDLLSRYSAEDKEWEQDKIAELTKQVKSLEQQLQMESVPAPKGGLIYSLPVKKGSFVTKGQLLAQIYQPGEIRLRAYVDEPDLGKIQHGQQVLVEWDGLPGREWTGVVEKTAKQVVALENRSVGFVACSIGGDPKELIPNLNIKVEIITARKESALVVPRSAVFSHNGKPAVMVLQGKNAEIKPVAVGLLSPDEIEITSGIEDGSTVVLNPGESESP